MKRHWTSSLSLSLKNTGATSSDYPLLRIWEAHSEEMAFIRQKFKDTLSWMRVWLMGDDPCNPEGELLFCRAGVFLLFALQVSSVSCKLTSIWWAKKRCGYLKKQIQVCSVTFLCIAGMIQTTVQTTPLRLSRVAKKK